MKIVIMVSLMALSNLCFAQEQSRKEKRTVKDNKEVFNVTIHEDDKPKPEFDLPLYFQQSLIYPEQGGSYETDRQNACLGSCFGQQ